MGDDTKKTSRAERTREEQAKASSAVSTNRRRLIRALTAGGVVAGAALPDKWSKPVVDSVVLPAHAQTTDTGFFGQGDLNNLIVMMSPDARDALRRLAGAQERLNPLDALIGTAHAGQPPSNQEVSEASSSSFGFVSGYLSPERLLTLRMDMKFFAGSENPLDITCSEDFVVPLCVEQKINEDNFRSLSLINCDEFGVLDDLLEARIKSIDEDHALISLRPTVEGPSDTLYLMRGGNRPNCPDCESRAPDNDDCDAPWVDE